MRHLSLFLILMIMSVLARAQAPAPIVGPSSVCIGSGYAYTDAVTGGTWSCSNPAIGTIGSVSGALTGVSAGVVVITYTLPSSADTIYTVSINPLPAVITGPSVVCAGSFITLSDLTGGGVWNSSNVAVATVDAGGSVYGNFPGTAVISYGNIYGCLTSHVVTVTPTPSAIVAPSGICLGAAVTATDAVSGGTWSTSDATVVTIDAGTGLATGAGAGTATITYAIGTGCQVTQSIMVSPTPILYSMTGGGSYCSGGAGVVVGLGGSSIGVNYQLYNGIAPVGAPIPGTGAAISFGTETAAGTYTVMASSGACYFAMGGSAVITVGAPPAVYTVSGGGSYCAGGSGLHIILSGSDVGVSYQVYFAGSPVGVAMPGTGSALDFGFFLPGGSYTIVATNMMTACFSNMMSSATIIVNPTPISYLVTGGGNYCIGGTGVHIGLSNSSMGVNYQLYLSGVPVGVTMAGTGTALDFGLLTAAGVYTVVGTDAVTACSSTMTSSATVAINPATPVSVGISTTPGTTVCPGTTVSFTAVPIGGGITPTYAWTVNGVATGSGITYSYTPLNGDVVAVDMTSSAACPSPATASGSVTMTATSPTITASASAMACDGSYTLTAGGGASYSWTPSGTLTCPTCASTGASPSGTTTYIVTGTDGSGCSNTASVTVDGNRIMGTVSPAAAGTIKVWLVQFNPSDSSIMALDSTTACTSGGSQYYSFTDPASGDYLVKAYLEGQAPGASGYLPTYATSSAYWYSATSISHTTGTENMNITMIYGTVPSGPGFIGGYVASGAGKGTTGSAPVVGMLIYLKDASGTLLTHTYTDASGNYSFSGLANGDYVIYPEDYQYTTTASTAITLNTSAETISGINFKQHTGDRTITPWDFTAVKQVTLSQGLTVYPNPTPGDLNIQWNNQATGKANVVITDVTGRVVYRSTININTASGQAQLSLQGVNDGLYMISVKNDNINYCGKLVIAQ